MKNPRMIAPLLFFLFLSTGLSLAENRIRYQALDRTHAGYPSTLTGSVIGGAKAEVDSVIILGGDLGNGDFEDELGNPDRDGWTSVDLTADHPNKWNISDYNASNLDPGTPGNLAWWCGRFFDDDCGTGDFGGYGNNWNEILNWTWPSPDPSNLTLVEIKADINVDTEVGNDRLHLQYWDENLFDWIDINIFDGQISGLWVYEAVPILPHQLTGPGLDEVHLRWAFLSDEGWSDEDCQFTGQGGAQIDNIRVRLNALEVTFDDLDTIADNWIPGGPYWVGDFAQVTNGGWGYGLNDIDPNSDNDTPQFVFVDDGKVVPGTGGSLGNSYTYFDYGYVVNSTGGLAGPDFGIHNEIRSPEVEWPMGNYSGLRLALDLYMHLPHFADNPDFYFFWRIRSTDTGDPADLSTAEWQTDGLLYYRSIPQYMRFEQDLTPYVVPGPTHFQIALGVVEMDVSGGNDATPAPYIDNVSLTAFEFEGPALTAREGHLAQDNFPAIGLVDYFDLSANSVRFDMARNIAPPEHLSNDPGDSIVCSVTPVGPGAFLTAPPEMYYKLSPNPLFDPFRTSGFPLQGSVPGTNCITPTDTIIEDQFYFDLPDQNFLFPGDVLHYYFEATEDEMGLPSTAILPADTTGFADFSFESPYPVAFEMRALPTVNSANPGDHPQFLVINDNPGRGADNEWDFALGGYGYVEGRDFDLYRVKEPASGLGNGIGGRSTPFLLEGYQSILYTCGDLDQYTISNGDFNHDAGDDVGTLDAWLQAGNRNLLATGDNLVFDLTNSGVATTTFATAWLGVAFVAQDVGSLLGGSFSLDVDTLGIDPPVIFDPVEWQLLGDQPTAHYFDAVNAVCSPGQFLRFPVEGFPYTLSAGTYHQEIPYSNQIISLPYDLSSIMEPQINKFLADNSLRGRLLREFLYLFGHGDDPGSVTGIPDLDLSFVTTLALEPVMLFTRNNGGGYGPATAMAFGQIETDATITVDLRDSANAPIVAFPKEDVWLESSSGNLAFCVGGTIADDDTDAAGTTTFTRPLSGGGHSLDLSDYTGVMVNGSSLTGPPLEIFTNSPDINGDHVTNLMDFAQFAFDYYYPDPCPLYVDYFWDGTINISDLILFAQSYGDDCWETNHSLTLTPLPAVDPLPAATVELFFDEAGTQKDLGVGVGVLFDVYVLLFPEAPVDVGGFAYRLVGDPVIPMIISHPYAPETTLGTDPDFETGFTECVSAGPGYPYVVDQMEMMLTAPGRTELSTTAIPGRYPAVVYGDCAGRLGFDIIQGPPARINPPGVIIIDPEPDALNAPWELAWPGDSHSGAGDDFLNEMEPGTYTLTWQNAGPDWIEPDSNPVVFTLGVGDTVTITGTYHTPVSNLVSIVDVPEDQGGSVELTWERSYFDAAGSSLEVTGYEVYRQQDPLLAAKSGRSTAPAGLPGWDLLDTVPATGAETYQYVAATTCDSTAAGICWTTLLVRVLTDNPPQYFDSEEMQGYSVDNLFPTVPTGLHVAYLAGGNTLTWDTNPDPDIGVYRIYRADIGNTTFPGGTPLAEVPTPGWFDDLSGASGSAWDYCYFVSAEDIHDNEGEPTLWSNTEVSGTEDNPLPRAFALKPCYPNPFNPHTTIAFDLPRELPVRLEVFDISGRLIRVLADGKVMPLGRHEEVWNGTSDSGASVATGVYFCRIQAGEFSQSGRMTLIK